MTGLGGLWILAEWEFGIWLLVIGDFDLEWGGQDCMDTLGLVTRGPGCEIIVRAKQSWRNMDFAYIYLGACDAPCPLTLFNLNCMSAVISVCFPPFTRGVFEKL